MVAGGEAFKHDIVKDIKDKQGLGNAQIENVDHMDFAAFDEKVEQSFQKFLKSDALKRKWNNNDIQAQFNTWLDTQYNKLNDLQFDEIEKQVIQPISFELNREATVVELSNIQNQLNADDVLSGKQLNMHIFSSEVDKNYIIQLFNLNFKDKDKLLGYLNAAQNNTATRKDGDESIRQFQNAISKGDAEIQKTLGKIDGKFGINTVKAFEQYIAKNLEGKLVFDSNTEKLNDENIPDVRKFIEQNKGKDLEFPNVTEISPKIAQELSNHNATINLPKLSNIDKGSLWAFGNGTAKVIFPHGELSRDEGNTTIKIDGSEESYTNIDDTIGEKLIKGMPATEQTSNNSGTGGDASSSTTDTTTTVNGNSNTPHTETQDLSINYYKNGDGTEAEEKKTAESEEQAIERLTTSSSNLLQRVLGINGYDEASALVIKGYNAMKNKPECENLYKLRAGLKACIREKGGAIDKTLLVAALTGDEETLKGEKKDILKISKLVEDKNSGKLDNQRYLKLILGVLNDYFVIGGIKGVDKDGKKTDTDVSSIMDLYNNELIGKNEKLFQNKKELEKEGVLDNIKGQLNDLEAELGVDQNTNKLSDKYEGMVVAMANIQKLLQQSPSQFHEIADKYTYNGEYIFDCNEKIKFACCLCDVNSDGKVDVSDRSTKTGQELFNLILDAQIEGQDAMANILTYALSYAKKNGHNNTLKPIENLVVVDKATGKITPESARKIIDEIQERPIIMQYLREMLNKTSVENTQSIIMNGGVESIQFEDENEKKFWEYMMSSDVDKAISDNMNDVNKQLENEIDNDDTLDLMEKQEYKNAIKNNSESIKRTIKYSFAGYLALNQNGGRGVGASVNLGDIFKQDWLNNFSIGMYGGVYEGALFGLSLGYGNRISNKKGTFSRKYGGTLGASFSSGSPLLGLLIHTGPEFQLNYKKLQQTLDAQSAQYIGIEGIGLTNFSAIGGGAEVSWRRDALAGIEQISDGMNMKIFESLYKAYNSSKNKSKFFNNKDTFVKEMKVQLEKDFKKTEQKTIEASANILFTGLSFYLQNNNGPDTDPTSAEVGKIFGNISNDFALNWKNTEIAILDGKAKFSEAGVGAIYLGKWIPFAMIDVTQYGSLFAHDTQESITSYEQSLFTESGMTLRENALDKDGYINQDTVDYLNKKLSILFPRGDMEKIGINGGDQEGPMLSIPKSLCKYLDISYTPGLEKYIKSSDETHFQVPANMKIGLSTYIGGGTMRANLVLGDSKKSSGDKSLTIDSEFDSNNNPHEYKPNAENISLNNVNSINAKINEISEKEGNKDFPLAGCERIDGEHIAFNILGGNISIDRNSTNTLLIQQGKLFLNSSPFGKLKIKKLKDNSYTVSFESSINKTFTIQYDKIAKFEGNFDFQNEKIDGYFKEIEGKLSLIDNGRTEYGDFMEQANKVDYNEAFNFLMKMLQANPNNDFDSLVKYLSSTDKNKLTDEDKMLVVDRFKAIFSYNPALTTPAAINYVLGRREDHYKTLPGYTKDPFPLQSGKDYRETVRGMLNSKKTFGREPHKNLIGMTAFYRGDNKAKSYLLTELGGTNVLGDVTVPIEQAQLPGTKQWLINNLGANPIYEKTLLNSIAKTLKTELDPNLTDTKIHKNLSGLLDGKCVDIGGKNVTIKTKYVFYLLGECGNESVGVEIEGVEENGYSDTTSVEIDTSGSSAGLYVRTQAAENQMGINEIHLPRAGSGSRMSGPKQNGTFGGPNQNGTYGNSN